MKGITMPEKSEVESDTNPTVIISHTIANVFFRSGPGSLIWKNGLSFLGKKRERMFWRGRLLPKST
jgi:hypothetical protein